MVVVTEASGLVRHRIGEEWRRSARRAETSSRARGYTRGKPTGTNGIGNCACLNHAFQVFAFENSTNAIPSGSAPAPRCTTRCPSPTSGL